MTTCNFDVLAYSKTDNWQWCQQQQKKKQEEKEEEEMEAQNAEKDIKMARELWVKWQRNIWMLKH